MMRSVRFGVHRNTVLLQKELSLSTCPSREQQRAIDLATFCIFLFCFAGGMLHEFLLDYDATRDLCLFLAASVSSSSSFSPSFQVRRKGMHPNVMFLPLQNPWGKAGPKQGICFAPSGCIH